MWSSNKKPPMVSAETHPLPKAIKIFIHVLTLGTVFLFLRSFVVSSDYVLFDGRLHYCFTQGFIVTRESATGKEGRPHPPASSTWSR
jgi:hypothetical protein